MIDRKHALSVTRQARLLGLSRGAVYYLPQPVGAADLALMRRLDELHLEHPFMGARMLRRQLQSEGIQVGRRHVRTLMRRMGMEALCPQPGTSQRHPGHKIYPYLLRQLAITRANQVWALDTTYIPMARGFVYLTAVVDVASRVVLAHKVAITMEACHAKEIIEQAFARFGVPEIVNTDQGSQFTAEEFTRRADRPRLQAVHGRARRMAGQCVRRAPVAQREVRAGVLKAYDSVPDARASIRRCFNLYNRRRPHSSLDGMTPDQAYYGARSLPPIAGGLTLADDPLIEAENLSERAEPPQMPSGGDIRVAIQT